MNHNKDKIIAKVLSGNADEKEIQTLQTWLKENPLNQSEFDNAQRIWETSAALKKERPVDVNMAWTEFKTLADSQASNNNTAASYPYLRIAASIALFVVLGFVLRIYFAESDLDEEELSSNVTRTIQPESVAVMTEIIVADTVAILPPNEKKKTIAKKYKREWIKSPSLITLVTGDTAKAFILPDNSIVFLNANSKLEYLANFSRNNRRVSLLGEGYFEIQKDSGQFVVACENTVIRGKGTSFNIKGYEKDKEVEVIVAAGEVEFSGIGKKEFKKLTLNSGETGLYKKESDVFVKNKSHRKNYKWWQKSFRAKIRIFFDKLLGRESNQSSINNTK